MCKENSKVTSQTTNPQDVNRLINIATQTLERNIGLINSCDTKTSIVLSIIGGLLAIILTSDGFATISNIINTCINEKNFCNMLYLIFLATSLIILALGLWNLTTALIAKVNSESFKDKDLDNESNIFFAGISTNSSYKSFEKNFTKMTDKELLGQITKEIYINSKIATNKYKKYNKGFKLSIIGFMSFIFLLLIGIYLY